jgi:hypothetical protein
LTQRMAAWFGSPYAMACRLLPVSAAPPGCALVLVSVRAHTSVFRPRSAVGGF